MILVIMVIRLAKSVACCGLTAEILFFRGAVFKTLDAESKAQKKVTDTL